MMALKCRMRRVRAVRDDSRGQLLIEVLIALAILGLIATVFIGAMYTSLQAARVTDERSTALTLAKSQIEFVKSQGFADNEGSWGYRIDTTGEDYELTGYALPEGWEGFPPPALREEYVGYHVEVFGSSEHETLTEWSTGDGIRAITATVFHHGDEVLTLENYEVDR